MALRHVGWRLLAVLVLHGLWAEAVFSQPPAPADLAAEIAKQEKIYQARTRRGGYKIDRSLADYANALSPQFDRALARLGPGDRWLDIGAGEGQAILDYYERTQRGRKAKAVALSIEDRRTQYWHERAARLAPDQVRYLSGKRLREYSRQELGRFRIISDVMGGFTYTENLSRFMEKVLDLLELNGDFHTVLQDVRSEAGTNPPYREGLPYLTEIANADGSAGGVCAWLKSIDCVNVTCAFRDDWQPPTETFHVHKVCDAVAVPALVPVHFEAGTPPERRFRFEGSARP